MNGALAILTAIQALKLKRASYRDTSEGVLITQPGKPDLLLTQSAIREFANQIEVSSHD